MVLRLHSTSTGLLLLVLILLLLLLGSGLCLSRLQWLIHILGGFVGLAVVIDRYLCLVFVAHGQSYP